MKQNAIGLTSICILSTCVLVTLSTTTAMLVGKNDILNTAFHQDIQIVGINNNLKKIEDVNSLINSNLKKYNVIEKDKFEYRGLDMTYSGENATRYKLFYMPTSEYDTLTNSSISLNDNELLLYTEDKKFNQKEMNVGDKTFLVKERLNSFPIDNTMYQTLYKTIYLVASNEKDFINFYNSQPENTKVESLKYFITLNIVGLEKNKLAFANSANTKVDNLGNFQFTSKQQANEFIHSMYGGLFFLGLFFGIIFLNATVLVIYYKQVSEGYEDRERFVIMQKVGMSKNDNKKSNLYHVFYTNFCGTNSYLFCISSFVKAFNSTQSYRHFFVCNIYFSS